MTNVRKLDEVQWYLDRMSEAALMIVKSVISNPSILDVEKELYLNEIARRHEWVTSLIQDKIKPDPVKIQEIMAKKLTETCKRL